MKRAVGGIFGVAVVIGLVMVGWGNFQPAAAADSLHFGYLVADQLHEPAPMIMKEKGYLKDEGFEVKWSEYLAGAYAMQHFSAGEVQAVTCGAVPVMIARGAGTDVVILASSNTEGSAIVVLPEIKSVKDLKNQKLGTPGLGSIQDAMVTMVEKKYGVKILHVPIKVSDMPIYLSKKEIKGYIAWEPHCSRAVELGYGKILLTSHDILPGHQCCVLAVQGKMIRENPGQVKRIMRAYLKAFQFMREHPEETMQMMVKYTKLSDKVVKDALKRVNHSYPPYADLPSIKLMGQILLDTNKIEKSKVPDLNKLIKEVYNDSFLKEAIGKK